MEFRGFVYEKKLVALSQYNHMMVSPRLLKNRDHLLKVMADTFENRIKPKLDPKFTNYVLDFAVTGKRWTDCQAPCEEEERVWVIELNPFQFSTDACMFSWKQEHDLMTKGREDGQVEFRLREKFDDAIFKGVSGEWRELLKMDL
jgi:D123